MTDERRGVLFGVAAYLLWGLFPLYWPLLDAASAGEILAHRFVWSFLFVLVVVAASRQLTTARKILTDRRRLPLLTLAAVLICVNWYVYIYGVNSGHVVETSLGYFINPLFTVLVGVVILRERLRRAQWVAVGFAAAAVLVLAVDYGRPPWIALTLAVSFGMYGLLKKQIAVGAAEGLLVESGVLLLPAAAYVIFLELGGSAAFGHSGGADVVFFVGAGVVTAIPLLLFAAAARRVPLVTIGLLQYLAPILQFIFGLVVFHEEMPPARWAGFGLVWFALLLFSVDQVRHYRRGPNSPPAADPVPAI